MRAAVCVRAGGPEVLEVREVPRPAVCDGWSLVEVKGAGLNRSELMTRQGHSPNVTFPRVLGIECVGVVAESTDPELPAGRPVAAIMGEMGREFDGGYAEFALLPNALLMPVRTALDWATFAALPETYLTAQGSMDALGIGPGSVSEGGRELCESSPRSRSWASWQRVSYSWNRRRPPTCASRRGTEPSSWSRASGGPRPRSVGRWRATRHRQTSPIPQWERRV